MNVHWPSPNYVPTRLVHAYAHPCEAMPRNSILTHSPTHTRTHARTGTQTHNTCITASTTALLLNMSKAGLGEKDDMSRNGPTHRQYEFLLKRGFSEKMAEVMRTGQTMPLVETSMDGMGFERIGLADVETTSMRWSPGSRMRMRTPCRPRARAT